MIQCIENNRSRHNKMSQLVGLLMLSAAAFIGTANAAEIDSKTLDSVKSQLLNDADFIKTLSDKVTNQNSDDHIKKVVKDYLVQNPEIMIEVQDALNQKQEEKTAESQSAAIKTMSKEIFNSPDDVVLGNPDGKVTLVEFFDYNCGYCKQSYPDIQALIDGDKDLRVVIKDFPILGPDSVKAHIVARAFKQLLPAKYPEFHRQLLTSEGRANEAKAIAIAVKLGADEGKLRNEMKDPKLQQPFATNGQIAYALNINGTPSYILGNEVMVGAVGEDILEKKIKAISSN